MKEKLDENFIKSLVVIALGIVRGKSDPYELVNGAVEYLISNKEKYMDHPNIKAVAVLKMKGLFIDEISSNNISKYVESAKVTTVFLFIIKCLHDRRSLPIGLLIYLLFLYNVLS